MDITTPDDAGQRRRNAARDRAEIDLVRGLVAVPSLSRHEAAASAWLAREMEARSLERCQVDGALNAVLDTQIKLGADVSVAAGPVGLGVDGAITTNAGADIFSYSTSQGLFAGTSLEGAVIARRGDWNRAFYDSRATPRSIVVDRAHANPAADALRDALGQF